MQTSEAYKTLLKTMEDYYLLNQCSHNLGWDMRTYMPPRGIDQRSKQLALISSIKHKKITDQEIRKLLDLTWNSPDFESLSFQQQRNLCLIEKIYTRETKLPNELVSKFAEQCAKTENIWEQAKKESNYSLFKPELETLLELSRQRAEAIDPSKEPFDVLMDAYYEPGMTSEKLVKMFEKLKFRIIPLVEKCIDSPCQPDPSIVKRNCPIEVQRKLSEGIARLVGYDFKAGRLDETEHPFTSGFLSDVRITTHYYANYSSSFFAVLHEAGHGMYEQAIRKDFAYEPVGEAASYGVHESQSRFIENNIGRSASFWKYYLPRFKKLSGNLFQDVEYDTMHFVVNQVALTPIRIFADELTYALHIILRFEIERSLLKNEIDLDDLPGIWNDKMKEYMRVDIKDDMEGVLQDVHWGSGYFGYFPSYELGNIYAAQLMAAMTKDMPDYQDQITQGNFMEIKRWLDRNIRTHGKMYDPEDLIEKATGEQPNVNYLLDYLTEKYTNLYEL